MPLLLLLLLLFESFRPFGIPLAGVLSLCVLRIALCMCVCVSGFAHFSRSLVCGAGVQLEFRISTSVYMCSHVYVNSIFRSLFRCDVRLCLCGFFLSLAPSMMCVCLFPCICAWFASRLNLLWLSFSLIYCIYSFIFHCVWPFFSPSFQRLCVRANIAAWTKKRSPEFIKRNASEQYTTKDSRAEREKYQKIGG